MNVDDKISYQHVIDHFTVERISSRYIALRLQMVNCLNSLGLAGKVDISKQLLKYAVLDYFSDIYRLKDFHTNIERVNTQKIYGYEAFWLLRRKPIQLLDTVSDDLIHINERIVMMIFIVKLMTEMDIKYEDFDEDGIKSFEGFAGEIYYHFRYRNLNQQSLELAAESLRFGNKISESINQDPILVQ